MLRHIEVDCFVTVKVIHCLGLGKWHVLALVNMRCILVRVKKDRDDKYNRFLLDKRMRVWQTLNSATVRNS